MYRKKIEKDIDKCIECGACYRVCPMMDKFTDSPRILMKDILNDDMYLSDVAYSCMLCDGCTRVCPKDISLKETLEGARKDLYNNKRIHKKYKLSIIKNHQKVSFSKVTTTSEIKEGTKKIFVPGCSLSSFNPSIVLKVVDYLKNNLENIDVLIKCCGKPSKDIGNVYSFEENIKDIQDIIKKNGIEEIIVACENCYVTFKKELEGVKVTSLWEVISRCKVPENIRGIYEGREAYAIHDPCPIKDEEVIHESVRNILNQIGLEFEEFKFNKNRTRCCGSGGMVGVTNKELFLVQKDKRASETDLNNIVSYCQSCVNTLKLSGKNTLHILDFLFDDEVIKGNKSTGEEVGFIKSWSNRINLKKKIKGEK